MSVVRRTRRARQYDSGARFYNIIVIIYIARDDTDDGTDERE